jgi:hypothetical protein
LSFSLPGFSVALQYRDWLFRQPCKTAFLLYGKEMTTAACDKYGFKTLKVGEFKYVTGVKPKHAQMMAAAYVKRYPLMVHRDFIWLPVEGGVKIERVR